MRKTTSLSFLVLWLLLTLSPAAAKDDGRISIVSFNIEWFGHGNKPRSEEQIARLADYLGALEFDVLCCQEIAPEGDANKNGRSDWSELLGSLGSAYDAAVGDTGHSQRLALIWRKSAVTVSDVGELRGANRQKAPDGKSSFPRRPLTAYVKSLRGGVDFRLIVVHLYWTSDPARYLEARQLRQWLKGYLGGANDPDVLLVGDCNTKPLGANRDDTGRSQTVEEITADGLFVWISGASGEYTTPSSRERYDHAFMSRGMYESLYASGSWDVRREAAAASPDAFFRDISNHCPVSLDLYDRDLDSSPPGDWGTGAPARDDSPTPRKSPEGPAKQRPRRWWWPW